MKVIFRDNVSLNTNTHEMEIKSTHKIALSAYDDKRYILEEKS